MKTKAVIFALLVGFCDVAAARAACQFTSSPETLRQTETELHAVWTMPAEARPDLNSLDVTSSSPALTDFRDGVLARGVSPEPFALLVRQRKIYDEAGFPAEVRKFDLLLGRKAGLIRPMSCLESLLEAEHLERRAASGRGSEFSAFVLEKGGSLRIYFQSGDRESPPAATLALARIALDRAEGWRVLSLLHNHPFFFGNPGGDIAGTTIPSDPDVQTFIGYAETLGLEEAWITNGFSTLVLKSAEFAQFR